MPLVPPPAARRRRRIHLLALIVTALALLTGYAVTVGASATAATTLLSQGKPATASSVEGAGTPASAAVDGNTGTRWSSVFGDPQWLQVDLGGTATVDRVVLTWEAAYASGYRIDVSADASTWTTIYSTTTGKGGTEDLAVSGTGRYVRMYGTVRATPYGYSLWEFQVFGTSGACGSTNAAQGKAATASSTESAGTPASAAVDGDAGTRWSSVFSDPQWLQVDLGATVTVCQVVLSWEAAYASAFQLQVSPDATTWTTVFSTTTGTGGTQTLDVTGTGRYIRMYGTARGTAWGYSLWEFTVHTTGASTGSLISQYMPVAASSYEGGNAPAAALDGRTTTRWSSQFSDPQWIYVDLGGTATV